MDSITEYTQFALATCNPRADESQEEGQTYGLMGLVSEIGEIAELMDSQGVKSEHINDMVKCIGQISEIIKKHYYHGHQWTRENYAHLEKEIGDLHWYWTLFTVKSGFSPEQILTTNIAKLKARYPEGYFTTERSVTRAPGDV